MTTGGSILFLRDPATLEVLDRRQITLDGARVGRVNELECVGDHIWANVFQSNDILKIDKTTGRVVARLDASGLVPVGLRGDPDAVLNGIAADPESGSFYLTGKLWPALFETRILPK
jgi:glutamine cyclotransferase